MPAESTRAVRTQSVARALERSGLEPGPERPCAYLPGRSARDLAFRASRLPPGTYHALMDLNFRRSGAVFYRPACRCCQQCRALRVGVDAFTPNRTQRRCWRRNQDLIVRAGRPLATEEKHRLFRAYLACRHGREMDDSWDGFTSFLYHSPLDTIEVVYRLGSRLVAVGIVDVEPETASTVYCYFDREFDRRSPGTFNVLWTIDYCRQRGFAHLYLGYYIPDCPKMNYKAHFRPCEVLEADGTWQGIEN